ncbi:MAG: hypothetical protein EBY09_17575, partial [Verrucomicrobia bacterium]|nr:hypothetical protein [Verrucomicrobiota bacterium]
MSADSGKHFFKQAGWLVAANLGCGVFMFAVHPLVSKLDPAEYGVFATLLKVFLLLGVPAAGLQAVFALQTATAKEPAAGTPRRRKTLSSVAKTPYSAGSSFDTSGC